LTDLPAPPIGREVDLRDFAFMPLDVARLRRSRAWLICKRRPELAFYMINLWTAAWHDTPSGSLEDDDDVLADLAMCDPKSWPKLRADVLRGWIACNDGRLYHPIVVEKAKEGWRSKLQNRYDRACGALRKAWNRAGKKDFVPPTFEDWSASVAAEVSQGQMQLSKGHTKDNRDLSHGQCEDSTGTSHKSPVENALKVRDRDSKGIGTGTHVGHVVSSGQDTDTADIERSIRETYPPHPHRADWFTALKHCRLMVERGDATWEALLAGTQRYAAYVAAGGVSQPRYVSTPVTFFTEPDKPWEMPWTPPVDKSQSTQDSNIAAGRAFLAGGTP
jgi:hypothetical protein